jgi:hypothetical protein
MAGKSALQPHSRAEAALTGYGDETLLKLAARGDHAAFTELAGIPYGTDVGLRLLREMRPQGTRSRA